MLTILLIYLGLGVRHPGRLFTWGGRGVGSVPMVVFTLTWQGVPSQHLMHLALGTSLASIIGVEFLGPPQAGGGELDGSPPDCSGNPNRDLSRFVSGGSNVHQPVEKRLCRLPLLYGVSDADQQKAQTDPGSTRPPRHVRRGQRYRGGVGPRQNRGRVTMSSPFMVV